MIQFNSYCFTPQGELAPSSWKERTLAPKADPNPFQISEEAQAALRIPSEFSKNEKLKGMRLKSGPFNFRYLLNLIGNLSSEDKLSLDSLVCMQGFPTMTGYRNAFRLGFNSNFHFKDEFFTERLGDIASHLHPMAALMNMPNQLLCNLGIELDFQGESVNFAGAQSGLQALDWVHDALTSQRCDSILLAGAHCLQADWLPLLKESSCLPSEWASLIHFKNDGKLGWNAWEISSKLELLEEKLSTAEVVLLDSISDKELKNSVKPAKLLELRPLIGQQGFLNPVTAMQTAAFLLLSADHQNQLPGLALKSPLQSIHILGRCDDKYYMAKLSGVHS